MSLRYSISQARSRVASHTGTSVVLGSGLKRPCHRAQARRGMSQLEIEDEVATDLQRATGTADAGAADSTRLNRVLQLTGTRQGYVAMVLSLVLWARNLPADVRLFARHQAAVSRSNGCWCKPTLCCSAYRGVEHLVVDARASISLHQCPALHTLRTSHGL